MEVVNPSMMVSRLDLVVLDSAAAGSIFCRLPSGFGTNLLIGGPAHIAVLLPISVFRRKGISNGVQTE